MIYEIYTENGTKKKRALTGNGYGLPLGTWISYEGTCPDGFIESEQTFNTTTYAALYALLGTNKVPARFDHSVLSDWESITISTDSNNPTVMDYDGFLHNDSNASNMTFFVSQDNGLTWRKFYTLLDAHNERDSVTAIVNKGDLVYTENILSGTYGAFYKRHLAIKATPAYVEPDTVNDMVNTLRTQDSYSTEEVNTGKKWIDGKPIYRRVIDDWTPSVSSSYDVTSWNIDKMVNIGGFIVEVNGNILNIPYYVGSHDGLAIHLNNTKTSLIAIITGSYATTNVVAVIEYTKTTD